MADGQAALDSVVRQRPDLILLDRQVPRMSGLTLLKHIREVESHVPIIVISATDDTKVTAEALRHGAVAYIPKPFDARHVEMLVTTFLDSIGERGAMRTICVRTSAKFVSTPGRRPSCPGANGDRPLGAPIPPKFTGPVSRPRWNGPCSVMITGRDHVDQASARGG